MSKKKMLDKAFRDAVTEINVNSIDDEDILEDVLATSMKAYAERENVEFTDDEIRATIVAGLETIREAGKDFSYQNKMML